MNLHGIKTVTNKTGLSSHVIRVWEKRYNAVTPIRTETNRRRYTDEDLERLSLLATLTKNGHSIGQIVDHSDSQLVKLIDEIPTPPVIPIAHNDEEAINQTIHAIIAFDQYRVDQIFDEASLRLGYSGFIEKIIIPLIQRVGTAWHSGNMKASEEHAATSFIKDYLSYSVRSFAPDPDAPKLLVTTPSGQLHELGAIIACCIARKLGWKVIYLGPSLPANEIASSAIKVNAAAILLSIVYPSDDPHLGAELKELRHHISPRFPILVGGASTSSYQEHLDAINAVIIPTISELSDNLTEVRKHTLSYYSK